MIVEIEGVKLEIENKLPQEGEMYIAERNVGRQLLTAKVVDYENRWIIPKESAYVYDTCECNRIVSMIE